MTTPSSQNDLRSFAAWIEGVSPADVPATVMFAARLQLANMLAAAFAAQAAPEAREVIDAADALGGNSGSATTLLDGQKRPILDAVLCNAAAAMTHDFDDIVWMGHTGHSAVFASLAVAESEDKKIDDLLLAIVIANELGGRLGASSFFGPLNGQMWSFIHLIGAAAATAKLLGLDRERTTNALSIALYQPTFPLQPGFMRPTSKLLTAATPTCTGIQAAYLARAGMTGDPRVLDDQRGFWSRFSFLPLRGMLGGLGKTWVTSTLACKTYPGCFYHQTTCTALARILDQTGPIASDDIASVRIETTKLATEVSRFAASYAQDEPLTAVGVTFDLRLLTALMLRRGQLTTGELHPAVLHEEEAPLRSLRDKVKLVHDPLLSARVVQSAMGLETGRAAIGALTARDLAHIASSYRREYRSSALSMSDIGTLIRGVAQRHTAPDEALDARGVPLYFPSRVTLRLTNGQRFTERRDLPEGSFASVGAETRIKAKFYRAVALAKSPEVAEACWAALMTLGGGAAVAEAIAPLSGALSHAE